MAKGGAVLISATQRGGVTRKMRASNSVRSVAEQFRLIVCDVGYFLAALFSRVPTVHGYIAIIYPPHARCYLRLTSVFWTSPYSTEAVPTCIRNLYQQRLISAVITTFERRRGRPPK